MKRGIKAWLMLAALGLSTAAFAAPKDGGPPGGGPGGDRKGPPPGVHGKVDSTTATSIVVKDREGNTSTITVDSNTKYTLDGKDATLADVKPGEFVNAMPETGTATSVDIHTKPPKRGPGGGGPDGGGKGGGPGGGGPGGGGPGGKGSGSAKN